MNNDITFEILKVVVSVCSVMIVTYLLPYLKSKIKSVKNTEIVDMVNVAVRAAEQTIKGSGMGQIKKENVICFLEEWFHKNGIYISSDQMSQLIEAAVWSMNNE